MKASTEANPIPAPGKGVERGKGSEKSGGNISFDPFEVGIVIQGATEPSAPPNAGGMAFIVEFSSFAGILTDGDDMIIEEINGAVSGELILFFGDVIFCDRDVFTADYQAIAQ